MNALILTNITGAGKNHTKCLDIQNQVVFKKENKHTTRYRPTPK